MGTPRPSPEGFRSGFSPQPITDEEFFSLDFEGEFLGSLFESLDREVLRLKPLVDWTDPDGPGLLIDQMEHHLGVGLVAIQRYMASVCRWLDMPRSTALKCGPLVRNELALAELLNAAANHWKHELDEQKWKPHPETRRILELFGFQVPASYIATNLLYRMEVGSLTDALPQLRSWRKAVMEHARSRT